MHRTEWRAAPVSVFLGVFFWDTVTAMKLKAHIHVRLAKCVCETYRNRSFSGFWICENKSFFIFLRTFQGPSVWGSSNLPHNHLIDALFHVSCRSCTSSACCVWAARTLTCVTRRHTEWKNWWSDKGQRRRVIIMYKTAGYMYVTC